VSVSDAGLTMAQGNQRKRLTITDGVLDLSVPGFKDLECLLAEIDEHGCLIRLSLQTLPPDVGVAWRKVLIPQQRLRARLRGFQIPDCEANVVINHLLDQMTFTEIELDFDQIPSELRSVLRRKSFGQAMHTFELPTRPAASHPTPPPLPRVGQKTEIMEPPSFVVQMAPVAAEKKPDSAVRSAVTMPTTGLAETSDTDFLRNKTLGEVQVHMGQVNED
jgi:hypothetical protein